MAGAEPGSHVRAAIYNAIAVPIAIAGLATLLLAALAMSGFSVLVAANDVRPCRLLLLGASMVHSPPAGICRRSQIFSCIAGRFQKPGQMPYDLRDRGCGDRDQQR